MLDTNVWRYIVDQDGAAELRGLARDCDLRIAVSPAVVFEQLRLHDRVLRKRLIDVTTRQWWKRLMPEAFVECQELVSAVRGHRPTWIVDRPSTQATRTYHRNRADWEGGFWLRARKVPARQAAYNETLGDARIEAAREQVATQRLRARESKLTLDTVSLAAPEVRDCVVQVESSTPRRIELWRVGAANHFVSEVHGTLGGSQTYRDWLDPFIDDRLMLDREAWLAFWLEVDASEVPTQWLAWAAQTLAPSHVSTMAPCSTLNCSATARRPTRSSRPTRTFTE